MSLLQNKENVITRFAPSPTGFLHIGGARTALFNWLFARHHNGKFFLRIEDTDQVRSTPEATEKILEGLAWLGLHHDGEVVYQSRRTSVHQHTVDKMLRGGTAYRCYSTKQEIQDKKAQDPYALFQSPWRDVSPTDWPETGEFVIRLRTPRTGKTIIHDTVQGDVVFDNRTLDDIILLRSDNSPTYMLAVVVDDYEMGITHIIRGDDHLTNAAKQLLIYKALGWKEPVFAHIPLIHGEDGTKLSKRHGALGIDAYKEMGYLPQTLQNYLARLGWSYGDKEYFSLVQATEWFTLKNISKGPARLDFSKMSNLNSLHIKSLDPDDLYKYVYPFVPALKHASSVQIDAFKRALPSIAQRAKVLPDFYEISHFIFTQWPVNYIDKIKETLTNTTRTMLSRLTSELKETSNWCNATLEETLKSFAQDNDLKFGKVAQPLRAILTNQSVSPGVLDVLVILGKEETIGRLQYLKVA